MRGVPGDRHPYRDRHLMRARKRKGFGWQRWSRQWLYVELGLFKGTGSIGMSVIAFFGRSQSIGS